MDFDNTLAFARRLDAADPLSIFKEKFHFPLHSDGSPVVYFCGNSLGLQPKTMASAVMQELNYWQQYGVEGWFAGDAPWLSYHKKLSDLAAPIVGALPSEVIVMNTLTVNLHLLMVSFYRPTQQRHKILMEGGAFPSDQYAVESQARHHGFDPSLSIVEIAPRPDEDCLRTEDIVHAIETHGDELALVLFGGVNYYTGQFYDLKEITKAAHAVGATVGFDLAHAAGNVPLALHDWNVDFAVWCGYKYLNSGPGSVASAFIHERHFADRQSSLPRFAGWWGHDEGLRFQMEKGFVPMHGAAGWQVSTAQIIPLAMHQAALEVFSEAGGMDVLRKKSIQLTAYLAFLLEKSPHNCRIITPQYPAERGAQLSILTDSNGKQLFDHLTANGVVCDWREPNVIRLAPVPLYCSFEDVWRVGNLFQQLVSGIVTG